MAGGNLRTCAAGDPVKDVEEAVETANAPHFANGASIFYDDGGKVRCFREHIGSGLL
ncbi:hypothetical protein [Paenibacillus sp. S150]|uniref:hypothetical protein n=1 Tax=Paenibacillus sp. S150 TaxID=2749826 RepID=UPI001C57491A|nr:hypothetical protein [Paenibacillus sp. S150]MBW4085089.1 hypothetical protein [Paenibacillus sp. S150]